MARTTPRRPPAAPPATVGEGAGLIHAATVATFARKDGEAADWKLMTEAVFKAAFDLLDKLPDDQRRSIARRVHAGAYDRAVEESADGSGSDKPRPLGGIPAPSNTVGPHSPGRPSRLR